MQYYIYGRGSNGKSIASFLGLYFPDDSYTFIDDSDETTSLVRLKETISKEDKILIASTLHYEKITQNLKQYHLTNYKNGIIWCGKVLNDKLKVYKQHQSFKKYIGLVVHKWTEQHFVDMESLLKQAGYGVVYFAFYQELCEKYGKQNLCLFAAHSILEQVEEVDMMLQTNVAPTSQKVISIDISHGFQGSLVYPFMHYTLTERDHLKYTYSTLNYIVCGSKKIHKAYENFLPSIQADSKLLDTGYLKLDADIQKYEEFSKNQQKLGNTSSHDIVIFAFTLFDDMPRIITLMRECFKLNLRALFKPHPIYAGKMTAKLAEEFRGERRFVREIDSKEELFYHSLCLITDCSSMGYTYPLTTAKPTLYLDLGIRDLGSKESPSLVRGGGDYYEQKLMYSCKQDSEFCEVLQKIIQEQASFPRKVEDYRQNECFGFGRSSQKLLEQIQIILGA